MKASPDRCLCCRRCDLHAHSFVREADIKQVREELCKHSSSVGTVCVSVCVCREADLRFRLINEVVGAQGGGHRGPQQQVTTLTDALLQC